MGTDPQTVAKWLQNNPDLTLIDDGGLLKSSTLAAHPQALEHALQAAVIEECKRRALLRPDYGMIFAVPNGQYRGGRPEAGLTRGIPDLFLPVPRRILRRQFHGMFIELKVHKNRPSSAQLDWLGRLRAQGYYCVVVWDTLEAVMHHIEWYLGESVS